MVNPSQLRRGYALLLVTGLVGVIFLLSLAIMDFMQAHRSMLRKAEESALALEASRAGLSLAISHLRLNSGWRDGFHAVELVPETQCWLQFSGPDRSWSSQDPGPRCLPDGSVHLICRGQRAQTVVYSEAVVALNTTLLENDFRSQANEWQQTSNLPVVALGHYVLDLGLQMISLAGSETWSDYQTDFEVLVPQGTGIGFFLRVSGAPGALTGYLVDYQLLDDPLNGGVFRLFRLDEGRPTELARATQNRGLGWFLGVKHHYRLRAQGDELCLWVDGESVLQFRDPEPIRSGRIGIRPLLGTVVLVDRVCVVSLFQVVSQWKR